MFEDANSRISSDNDSNPDEYMEACRVFLSLLTDEQKESLKNKFLYHVTNVRNSDSILQNGLDRRLTLSEDAGDFDLLEYLYEKYGRSGDRSFFERMTLGRDAVGSSRPIYLSSEPLQDYYEVPERLKFLLRNYDLLAEAPYVTQEEREKCKVILNKYYKLLTSEDSVNVVFRISIVAPVILNSLIGGASVKSLDQEQALMLYEYVKDFSDANYQIYAPIKPEYLEEVERVYPKTGVYERSIRRTTGMCFDEKIPGTPVSFEQLNTEAKKVYLKFKETSEREPTLEEILKFNNFK